MRGEGAVRLALESMVAWTPRSTGKEWFGGRNLHEDTEGMIVVGPWPDKWGWSDEYRNTTGACYTVWHRLDWEGRKGILFIEAMHIATFSEIDPLTISRAMCGIAEYVDWCSNEILYELFGSNRIDEIRDEVEGLRRIDEARRLMRELAGREKQPEPAPRSIVKKKTSPKKRRTLRPSTRFYILTRDEYRCCTCGCKASNETILHVDHRVPVSAGGSDDIENLWTLCAECNMGKGARLLEAMVPAEEKAPGR